MDFKAPKLIKSASGSGEMKMTKAAEGVLKSAHFTTFQHQAMAGVVKSAMPDKMGPAVKMMGKVKAGKTKQDIGVVHYPGSKYAAYPKRK